MSGAPPSSCYILTFSVYAYTKSNLLAEISHLEVPAKGLRKRRSTTAMRENDESRKKLEISGRPKKIEVDKEVPEK